MISERERTSQLALFDSERFSLRDQTLALLRQRAAKQGKRVEVVKEHYRSGPGYFLFQGVKLVVAAIFAVVVLTDHSAPLVGRLLVSAILIAIVLPVMLADEQEERKRRQATHTRLRIISS